MSTDTAERRAQWLASFVALAGPAGLATKKPGSNWTALPDLAAGSHVSVSITREQVQVNLNLEGDASREVIRELAKAKNELARQLGVVLLFEDKQNTAKSAVRASLGFGLDSPETWTAQHHWAVGMMFLFQTVFRPRVQLERHHSAFGVF